MPDMLRADQIILRPGTTGFPVNWEFAACSALTLNDGSLPFGTTIASADVKFYSAAGVEITSTVLVANSIQVTGGLRVSARINHPGGTTTQRCSAVIICTLSTGAVITFDCRRILVDGTVG